tara:strand:- start:14792 stop:15478 length:687 start_codon:yes stop_codon:yes gene_type:complete
MSFNTYIKNSLKLFEDIYTLFSDLCSIPITNNNIVSYGQKHLQNIIISKYNNFSKMQTEFCNMIGSSIINDSILEPDSWKEYIKIQNNGNNFLTIKIIFYVDEPLINEYGIIIEDRTIQKHYKFKQTKESLTQKIKYTSDIVIIFSDEIVDKIRNGSIPSNGRLRIFFKTDLCPILRLPFHPNNLQITNRDWLLSVLNSMDNEIETLPSRLIPSKRKPTITKVTNTRY